MEGFSKKWFERGKGLGLKNGSYSSAATEWRAIKGKPKNKTVYGEAMASFSAGFIDGARVARKTNPVRKPGTWYGIPPGAKKVRTVKRGNMLVVEFKK